MDEKKELLVIDSIIVQNLIYTIRGRQVMLDSDLAELQECLQKKQKLLRELRLQLPETEKQLTLQD